ncbi:MAG: amino acid-binding protein [Bacteroidaceae bacterium]|nr:amino acid-binding protein [Candidatus Colenecus caballi]MCQ2072522.1 amino acid-binding protein [Bacteroidaceae bacterium]
MLIRQISVFLENKQGMFAEIARLLGNSNINMKAFTVSETEDFGIARIIVERDQIDRAFNLIKANSYAVTLNRVVYLECGNVPGAMANAMEKLAAAGISVEYMYAFADTSANFSRVIIRPDNIELANQIIQEL